MLPEFKGTPNQLSLLFFGGELTFKAKEPMIDATGKPITITSKSSPNYGQIKFHRVNKVIKFKGLGVKPKPEWLQPKTGKVSTKKEVLQTLALNQEHVAGRLATLILQVRKLEKQLSTYFHSVEELIYETDGCVHASISHCGYGEYDDASGGTETGRLSSNNPNIQNQPKNFESKVKEHFVSRYKGGKIVEADFSQIEIVVQAQLSGDQKFIQDVLNGIDFHSKRLAMKEKVDYTYVIDKVKNQKDPIYIEKRSKVKQFSFARAYGAGAAKIAYQTGMTVEEVKELIKLEDLEYARLKQYNDYLAECVTSSAINGVGYYKAFTGRKYIFTEEDAPDWQKEKGTFKTFSPTKIKNYMVQGTATADIVLIMLGVFWREAIKHREKFLLINTVHDSIILDVRPEYVEFAQSLLKDVLDSTVNVLKFYFNYNWTLPINHEIKVGDSWYDC